MNQTNTGFTGFDGGYSNYVSTTIPVNEWTHLCVTVDNGTSRFYKNGVLIDTKSRGSGTLVSDASNTMIGRETYAGGYFSFNGDINDVRIYDHCLSKKEVKDISKALVLHYSLDEYVGENILGNHGQISSGSAASGITRETMSDGSIKFTVSSGNGNWATCICSSNDNANFGNKLAVGDKITVSYDIFIESGSGIPSVFLNAGNGYAGFIGNSTLIGKWQRVYCNRTLNEFGTSYGNLSWHFGWSSCQGVFYVKNLKIEKGTTTTPIFDYNGSAQTTMFDSSGFKNNGSINGSLSLTNDTKRYDCSTLFDSVGISTNYTNYKLDVFTYSAWVKLTAYHSERSCISIGGTYFTIDGGGRLSGYAYGKSSEGYHTGSTTIPLNTWAHVALVWTTTQLIGYVNGVQDFAVNCTGSFSSSTPHCIGSEGANKSSRKFTGYISDLREYATALSSEDILELYNTSGWIDKSGNVNSFLNKEESNSVMVKKNGKISSNIIVEYDNKIKTLSDGSTWVLLLRHNNPASYLFTSSNCWNYNDGSNLYSALHLLKNTFWMDSNGKYEFLVCEKSTSSSSEQQVRWSQTSNPATSSTVTGYTLISGSPGRDVGLKYNGSYGCFHNGATWWCCCGSYTAFNGGIPGFFDTVTTGCLDFYVRYPYSALKTISENQANFYKDGSVLGNQFIEI